MAVVIGANGYLGTRLGSHLKTLGKVCLVARRGAAGVLAISDLRSSEDREKLLDLVRGETVFYCAAVGGRQAAEADPEAAFAVNAEIPTLLAAHTDRFIYFSTDYIFTKPGRHTDRSVPDPTDTYSRSKAAGERGVLAACSKALVIRVSGLFDVDRSRDGPFDCQSVVTAPDNRRTRPTFVPDLIETTLELVRDGASGVRHVCGPTLLSPYEFWQIVSLRWKVLVEPTLDLDERFDVDVVPSSGVQLRSPVEVFAVARHPPVSGFDPLVVSDCVGVVLSARTWARTDPKFWFMLDNDVEAALRQYGAHCIADAYCPNPAVWHQLRDHPPNSRLLLANNGPWASFALWAEKYGFAHVFDDIINSERDGLVKPTTAFRDHVRGVAGDSKIRLIDDRTMIVECARRWGWTGVQTTCDSSFPVEKWHLPPGTTIWGSR